MLVVFLLADELLHEISPTLQGCLIIIARSVRRLGTGNDSSLLPLAPHDGPLEPQPQADRHAIPEGLGECIPIVFEVELGEEAETAERETQDGRDNALEEPARVQNGAVAAQCDDEVEGVRPRPT
jgi:hypothetical protein